MPYNLEAIAAQFQLAGSLLEAKPYGSGHINDTYCLVCQAHGGQQRYVLQRINHQVFKQPVQVSENIRRVTKHIRTKLREGPALKKLLASENVSENLYLAILSRPPSNHEWGGGADLPWILINSTEFLFRH